MTGCSANKQAKPAEPAPGTAKAQTVFAVNTTKAVSGFLKNYLRVNADVRNTSSVDVGPGIAGQEFC